MASRLKSFLSGTRKTARGTRKVVRGTKGAAKNIGKAYEWIGTETYCPDCRKMVKTREWASHVEGHRIVDGPVQKRHQNRHTTMPEPRPNEHKTRERRRRELEGQPQKPIAENLRRKDQARAEKEIEDLETRTARGWDRIRKEQEQMAQANGTQGLKGPSGDLAQAGIRWGDAMPMTREEMQEHLLGGTRAFAAIADAIRHFAQQAIVARKLHPAIARPIESVADSMSEDRLEFTRAYVILCQIYRNRIEYEEQQGPKPEDEFWKTG